LFNDSVILKKKIEYKVTHRKTTHSDQIRKMSAPLAKRFKCEYSVLCEESMEMTTAANPQWKLTIESDSTSTNVHKKIIFSKTNNVSACSAIAEMLHVDSAMIESQIHVSPEPHTQSEAYILNDISFRDITPYQPSHESVSASTHNDIPTSVVDYDFVYFQAKRVFHTLGPGYSESIYHKALSQELSSSFVSHEMERVIPVTYQKIQIGVVRADIIVQNHMVVELKAVAKITPAHLQQAERYARLLCLSKVIVINFPGIANANVEVHVLRETWQNISNTV